MEFTIDHYKNIHILHNGITYIVAPDDISICPEEIKQELNAFIQSHNSELIIDSNLLSEIENIKMANSDNLRISQIKAEMELLDKQSIRPMRDGETERLLEINNQISALREELRTLES